MSSNSHQPIYNQQDMDNVLDAIRKFKKEAEQSHQLLWAVLHQAGGEISLPYYLWSGEISEEREVIFQDDFDNFAVKLIAVDPEVTRGDNVSAG